MSGQDLHIRPSQPADAPAAVDALTTSPSSASLSLDLDEILSATCKFVVDLLNVDHSGLMVFDAYYGSGHVISEYPHIGTKGLTIPLRGVPTEERMIDLKEPIVVPDISIDSSFTPVSDILRQHSIQSVLIVPLISKGRLLGSLGLDMIGEMHRFTPDEIQLCEVFAKQAAAVIELYEQNKQRADQLTAIQSTVLAVNTKEDLRSILDTLTSQAVRFLGAKDGGVSQFYPERGELTVIADYKYPHFIGKTIRMEEGLAGHVIRDDLTSKAVEDYNNWSGQAPVFAKTERFGAVLMVNLKWQNHTVGVMYINAECGHQFPDELSPLLSLLTATAAMAMANSHLLQEVEIERMRVRSTYEAGGALTTMTDAGQALQNIANRALEISGAEWVRLMLIDESGPRNNFVAARDGKLLPTENRVRTNGISMRVLRTGEPRRIPDVDKVDEPLNPAMIKEGSHAALCLPLSCGERRLGVIWFHYSRPREFSGDDEERLAGYLSQAIVSYDNARQMELQLEPLWLATEGVTAAATTKEVLERIVTSAREILHADCAILWLYPDADNEPPQNLLVRDAITAGVDEALRKEVIDLSIPVGEITRGAVRERWVGIPDIDEPTPTTLPAVSLNLLRRLGAKSFEGLGLVVAGEELGVLYLVYKSQRDFRLDETRRARTFATHAALALKKFKLADQVTRAHRAAQKVTELTILGDMQETLESVADNTKEVLGCDAVTLFVYDESTDRILPLTTMRGVRHERNVNHCEDAPRDSIVYLMLDYRDEPCYCVRDVSEDLLFSDRPFIEREEIKSVCAIPLKVGGNRVGVMFINYRTRHRFTKDELDIITLFANQAAVAIRNNLLYKEQKKRLDEQRLLVELSEQLLGADRLEQTLELGVRYAVDSLKADFVAIVLPDEGRLKIAHGEGWTEDEIKAYERARTKTYQTAFTISQRRPVFITDYCAEDLPFDVPDIVKSKGIKSGMSVPVWIGGEPVGAMLAHFKTPRRLAELKEWESPLSLIANLTAASIRQQRAIKTLKAVQLASDEISRIRLGTEQREVLDKIVEQAVACLPQAFMGTIQLYDEASNELVFESVYAQVMEDSRLFDLVGERRPLNLVGKRRPLVRRRQRGRRGNKGRIGVAGRTVLEKAPQLVDDVTLDPDYFEFSTETKSELAVPLLTDDNTVLGVLNVESKSRAAFSKDDEEALLALAKLVVATIQNAEQYRLLENEEQFRRYQETRKLVEASTTLAWMGMASNDWGHSVESHALAIRGTLKTMRKKFEESLHDPALRKSLELKINRIDELAEEIRNKPVVALLSIDAAPSDASINRLIEERVGHLRGDPKYKAVHVETHLTDKDPLVRCSPDWIKRMLDILISNAVSAMRGSHERRLTISTMIVRNQVEIAVSDTGTGIPPDIKHKLFRQVIDNPARSEGLGIGLLMVQAIAQVYRGGARVGKTGPEGTTIYVRLPVVEFFDR
jgi:GAF domain-containing protein